MTATLTERSEGTAAHKGFNPKRKLENRDWAAVIYVKANATIMEAWDPNATIMEAWDRPKERARPPSSSPGGEQGRLAQYHYMRCARSDVCEDRERRRRTPAVHQGRAGEPGDPPAPRGDPGPHRAAL